MRLGLGLALTDFGTKGGVSDTPDLSGSLASVLLAAYGGYGLSFDFTETPSAKISDSGTPANNYDSSGTITSGALVGPGGKITYTSPSAKNTLQSDGYIYMQAHNLYLNSASPADQAVTVTSGATYRMTITGSVSITVSGAATGTYTAGNNDFTAASGTLTCGSTSGSGTVHLRRTPSVSTYLATGASAVYDLPYIHSSGIKTGILPEAQATNVAYPSLPALSEWSQLNHSETTNSTDYTSPFNDTKSTKFTLSGGSAVHLLYPNSTYSSVSGTSYGLSFIVHGGTVPYMQVLFDAGTHSTAPYANFDMSDGSVTASSGCSTYSEDLQNGWYRIGIIAAADTTAAGQVEGYISPQSSSSATYNAAANLDGLVYYLRHAQQETGVVTSPIITYAGTVTRNADNPTVATSLFPWSATVDSMMVLYVPGSASTELQPIYLSDGTADEVVALGNTSGGAPQLKIIDGGAAQTAPLTDGTVTANGTEKLAAKFKANAFLLSDNGAAAVSDTSGTLPTVTTLRLGGQAGSMLIKQILIVPVDYDATAIAGMATQ